jgi:hypothetical protein
MIPIDRKEQNRQESDLMSNKDNNSEQQSKIKKDIPIIIKPEISSEEINNDKQNIKMPTETKNDEYVLHKYFKNLFFLISREVLFGGSDIDYRDTDVTTQQKPTTAAPNLDTDRLFKLNSECLLLAEQKFKSKELSSEEYQATLKLLQSILQTEVQRLTVPTTLVFFFIIPLNKIKKILFCLVQLHL